MNDVAYTWSEPRPVAEWWWLEVAVLDGLGRAIRVGCVSWNRDGSGYYKPNITIEEADGLGLYCWPAFRVLADAQTFVEWLMDMAVPDLLAIHGTQWPNVVLDTLS